jgi:protease-4
MSEPFNPQSPPPAVPAPPGSSPWSLPGRTNPLNYPSNPEVTPHPQQVRPGIGFVQFLLRAVTAATLVPVTIVVSLVATALFFGVLTAGGDTNDPFADTVSVAGTAGSDSWVLVVPVSGVIVNSDGFGSTVGGAQIRERLETAATDPRIRAVVLELSTPGGTIPGSIDIAAGVEAVKAAGKPVVAYVADLSASGGMWAMSPADRIVAHPGSVVGSIGVIFGPLRRYQGVTAVDDGLFSGGVTTNGGIEEFYVTAGRSKDVGNPYRALTDEERAFLQSHVDGMYGEFVAHVAKHRDIDPARIRDEFGANIFRSEDAVGRGLVDEIGSRADAFAVAVELAGLTGRYDVREIEQGGDLFSALFGQAGTTEAQLAAAQRQSVSTVCGPTRQVFAFHGDLGAFCTTD